MNENKISVVVITKNEEDMIDGCLASVKWADEIIVIDTGSIDNTNKIALTHKAKIVKCHTPKMDFSAWRNAGLNAAKGNWLFYLDADERATEGLEKEMKSIVENTDYVAYEIPRRNFFLGQEMHYSGVNPDYIKRFFKRNSLKGWHRTLHEDPVINGRMGRLQNSVLHYTHRDITSMMKKTIKWTGIEANLLYNNNHPLVVWWRFLRMMLTKFFERVVKQQAWRDGPIGWINSIFEVFDTFIIYARLWEIQKFTKTS